MGGPPEKLSWGIMGLLILLMLCSCCTGLQKVESQNHTSTFPTTAPRTLSSDTVITAGPRETWSSTLGKPVGPRGRDIDLMKLDTGGNIQWETRIEGSPGENDLAVTDVVPLADGGYAITVIRPGICRGYETRDVCLSRESVLLRLDRNGTVAWHKVYQQSDPPGHLYFEAITPAPDGGFAAYGFGLLHFLDAEGNLVKSVEVDHDRYSRPYHLARSMVAGEGGDILLMGYNVTGAWYMTGWLAIFDRHGNLTRETNKPGGWFQRGFPTSDGGYLVTGYFDWITGPPIYSPEGHLNHRGTLWNRLLVMKLDAQGKTIWSKWSSDIPCDEGFNPDVINDINGFRVLCSGNVSLLDTDGRNTGEIDLDLTSGGRMGFTSDGNFWAMDPSYYQRDRISKFDPGGRVLWMKYFPGTNDTYVLGEPRIDPVVLATSDGGLLVARSNRR